MKYRKTICSIIMTAIITITVCFYLIHVETVYDGAVDTLLGFWTITLPMIACTMIWGHFRRKNLERQPQKCWVMILVWGFISLVSIVIFWQFLINPYSLPSILFVMILLLSTIATVFGKMIGKNKAPKEKQTEFIELLITLSMIYLVGMGTIWGYLQIVHPLTVSEAETIVSQNYGDDTYRFIGRLDTKIMRENNPLGVYYFVQKVKSNNITLEVSVIDGEITECK